MLQFGLHSVSQFGSHVGLPGFSSCISFPKMINTYGRISSQSLSTEVSHMCRSTSWFRPLRQSVRSVLVVWYSNVLVVVAAVVRRVEEVGGLLSQAGALGFVAGQQRLQVVGLLRQLLHLLPQSGVLLLQVLALLRKHTLARII